MRIGSSSQANTIGTHPSRRKPREEQLNSFVTGMIEAAAEMIETAARHERDRKRRRIDADAKRRRAYREQRESVRIAAIEEGLTSGSAISASLATFARSKKRFRRRELPRSKQPVAGLGSDGRESMPIRATPFGQTDKRGSYPVALSPKHGYVA